MSNTVPTSELLEKTALEDFMGEAYAKFEKVKPYGKFEVLTADYSSRAGYSQRTVSHEAADQHTPERSSSVKAALYEDWEGGRRYVRKYQDGSFEVDLLRTADGALISVTFLPNGSFNSRFSCRLAYALDQGSHSLVPGTQHDRFFSLVAHHAVAGNFFEVTEVSAQGEADTTLYMDVDLYLSEHIYGADQYSHVVYAEKKGKIYFGAERHSKAEVVTPALHEIK